MNYEKLASLFVSALFEKKKLEDKIKEINKSEEINKINEENIKKENDIINIKDKIFNENKNNENIIIQKNEGSQTENFETPIKNNNKNKIPNIQKKKLEKKNTETKIEKPKTPILKRKIKMSNNSLGKSLNLKEDSQNQTFYKLQSNYTKEQIDYLKKCALVQARINMIKKQDEELNHRINVKKEKLKQINKIIEDKKKMKNTIDKMKNEKDRDLKEKQKKIKDNKEFESNKINQLTKNRNEKQKLYQEYLIEKKKNKEALKEKENKIFEEKKIIVKRVKDGKLLNRSKSNYNNYIDEKDKNFLTNTKLEIERLKSKYEELTQQENEYIKKLKETKRQSLIDDEHYFSKTNLNSFNNRINQIKKKKNSSSQSKIRRNKNNSNNLTKSESNIDFINININVNTNVNSSNRNIHEISFKKKKNRSKSNSKTSLTKKYD